MNDILVGGQWRPANSTGSINAVDPRSGQTIEGEFPISNWDDCAAAIEAAVKIVPTLETASPDQIALFLRTYACLLYTSPSPRDLSTSRMPSSA